MSNENIPSRYKPISPWTYFWLQILFNIPIIGFICLCIIALGGTNNINKRNFARSYFCVYALILVFIGLLAAVGGLEKIISFIK